MMYEINVLKIYQHTGLMPMQNVILCLYLTVFILFSLTGGLSGQKSSGGSRNTAAVVGLGFLLLVLLLILAQMYKNHQRVNI